jgi:uncharacterized protein YkwD
VFKARTNRLRRITGLALPLAAAALTVSVPAAAARAHHTRHPDPIAHTAVITHVGHRSHRHNPMAHAASTCPNADTPAVGAPAQEMRIAVDCLINVQRARHHLPALHPSKKLDRSAQGWTNSMVSHNDFWHGNEFWTRITAVGYTWSNVGENIATGFGTPRDVVQAWMGSTDHCHNILDPQYANVGTGVSSRPVRSAASGPATWTQDFGLPMGAHSPSGNWGPANGCPY